MSIMLLKVLLKIMRATRCFTMTKLKEFSFVRKDEEGKYLLLWVPFFNRMVLTIEIKTRAQQPTYN